MILFESVLSFRGIDIQPSAPLLGQQVVERQKTICQSPMLAVYRGMLILITVAAGSRLGNELQAAFDPR